MPQRGADLAGILEVQYVNRPEIIYKNGKKRPESRNLQVLIQTDLLEEAMDAGLMGGDIYVYSQPPCTYRGKILTPHWLEAVWSMVQGQRSHRLSTDMLC